ncbi:MAG: hypothetical protein AAB224_09245 [Gemmatimonadota bacterium]
MHRLSRLLVFVAAFVPQVAHAWQPTPTASTARVGELVRVRTSGRTSFRGTLELASPDLVVIRDGGGAQRTLRADMVRAIDARRVRPWGQRARRGALVGAAIGFLVPAVTSLAKGKQGCAPPTTYQYCEKSYENIEETAGPLMILFGGIGLGVGAAVPWNHWQRVNINAVGTPP